MLIRFAVTNHLSIRERQEISLVASSLKDEGVDLIETPYVNLLPAAVLYGGNASGKSSFITSMNRAKEFVLLSHEKGRPLGGVPRKPFLLDDESHRAPSTFEFDFIIDNVHYEYGFSLNDTEVTAEWLYAYPHGKRQTWYVRSADQEQIYFGKQLRGTSRAIESMTRINSLYLSTAAQHAHKQLMPIYSFFDKIEFVSAADSGPARAITAFSDGTVDRRIIGFLSHADTGICEYRFDSKNTTNEPLWRDLISVFNKYYPPSVPELTVEGLKSGKDLSLGHRAADGVRFLAMNAESNGTLRLLILLRSVFAVLDSGSTVLVDEIDASLHPYITERIMSVFSSKATNPHGAQLIATTHDTRLLAGDTLRRDQVWFTEKNDQGATVLYPLTDIRTRGSDNKDKGYLDGRFGGVPFPGSVRDLVGTDEVMTPDAD